MHAHLQATRMLPSAVYLLDSKFTPFKLQTSPEFKRNITYFCCHRFCYCCFLFFEGREKMARRPYVSPEALYSSIMDSVGYPEIYSLKRKYLPIFQSHRIKPIKPFRHRIYAIILGFGFHSTAQKSTSLLLVAILLYLL